jgi:hypothetical protein
VFDYIEMFYNPNRKHTNNGMLSPVDYEITQRNINKAGVYETRGTSLRPLLVGPRSRFCADLRWSAHGPFSGIAM